MDAGEYEETIARVWHRRANLKCMVSKVTAPKVIKNCKDIFLRLFNIPERNSLAMMAEEYEGDDALMDEPTGVNLASCYDRSKEKTTSPEISKAFYSRGIYLTRAIHKNQHRQHGVLYTAKHVHEGNSGVLVRIGDVDVPFCIQNFLELPSKEGGSSVWIVGQRHSRPNLRSDPFLAYPYLRARMWSPLLDDKLEAFPLSEVRGQFAKCQVPWVEYENGVNRNLDVVVCVSLSRVQAIL